MSPDLQYDGHDLMNNRYTMLSDHDKLVAHIVQSMWKDTREGTQSWREIKPLSDRDHILATTLVQRGIITINRGRRR